MPAVLLCWESLSLLFAPSVGRLGDPDYLVRESAARQVHVWVAYPLLRRAADSSPDPEVRNRAGRLAARVERRLDDLGAWWCLVGPEPDGVALFADHARRLRLLRLCERYGVGPDWYRERLDPANDPDALTCFFSSQMPWDWVLSGVRGLRAGLRGEPIPTPDYEGP